MRTKLIILYITVNSLIRNHLKLKLVIWLAMILKIKIKSIDHK